MEWPEYCGHVQTPEGKRQAEQVVAQRQGVPPDFEPATVEEHTPVELSVQKSFLILNQAEMISAIAKPLVRHPKTAIMEVPVLEGHREGVMLTGRGLPPSEVVDHRLFGEVCCQAGLAVDSQCP